MADDAQTPNADQAYDFLYSQLYAPSFFEKLAAAGIHPASEADARQMLTDAGKLRVLYESEQQATAATATTRVKNASQELDKLMVQRGLAQAPPTQPTVTPAIKTASAEAAKNPDVARAVLTLLQARQAA